MVYRNQVPNVSSDSSCMWTSSRRFCSSIILVCLLVWLSRIDDRRIWISSYDSFVQERWSSSLAVCPWVWWQVLAHRHISWNAGTLVCGSSLLFHFISFFWVVGVMQFLPSLLAYISLLPYNVLEWCICGRAVEKSAQMLYILFHCPRYVSGFRGCYQQIIALPVTWW